MEHTPPPSSPHVADLLVTTARAGFTGGFQAALLIAAALAAVTALAVHRLGPRQPVRPGPQEGRP
ncbi:MAG: hypothetical protein H0V93_02525 [Euzebyales bacterium]|nr:hypothetical protein [Euzebyales bacterium]